MVIISKAGYKGAYDRICTAHYPTRDEAAQALQALAQSRIDQELKRRQEAHEAITPKL